MKLLTLFATNTILSALVIGNAFSKHKQFYSSVVHIMESKTSLMALIMEAMLCLALFVQMTTSLFFSHLIGNEREGLRDFFWPSVLDSCLAFAVFGRNADYFFYLRLICLLYFKLMHQMAHLRVNSMSTVTRMPKHFHFRFIGLIIYLALMDGFQISYSSAKLFKSGLSMEILYLFEYSLLSLNLIQTIGEFILEFMDQRMGDNGWEGKLVYQNYLELISVASKALTYAVVMRFLIKMKVLPIFMARSLVQTLKKAKQCFDKVMMSWRAIARINRFPKPAAEDLQQDSMCSICRDEIQTIESAKKLFCKHVFHTQCLKAWLRRQQRCPTCRSDVTTEQTDNRANGQQNNDQRDGQIANPENQN